MCADELTLTIPMSHVKWGNVWMHERVCSTTSPPLSDGLLNDLVISLVCKLLDAQPYKGRGSSNDSKTKYMGICHWKFYFNFLHWRNWPIHLKTLSQLQRREVHTLAYFSKNSNVTNMRYLIKRPPKPCRFHSSLTIASIVLRCVNTWGTSVLTSLIFNYPDFFIYRF